MPKAAKSRKSRTVVSSAEPVESPVASNTDCKSDLTETLELLMKTIPCRDQLIKEIVSLVGNPLQLTPQCLFLYGHTSSGKSLVLESIAQFLDVSI